MGACRSRKASADGLLLKQWGVLLASPGMRSQPWKAQQLRQRELLHLQLSAHRLRGIMTAGGLGPKGRRHPTLRQQDKLSP